MMQTDFGMPSLIELHSLEETAALCHEMELRFIELNMNFPAYGIEGLGETDRLLRAADEHRLYYTIHLDENLNVADFNRLVSGAYLDTVSATIDAAKRLGAPLINMHMHKGIHLTLPDRKVYLFEQYHGAYLNSFRIFRDLCEDRIGGNGIVVSIENTDGFTGFQRDAIGLLLESPVFSLTWDIGHSHGANDIDEPFILDHADRLKHFHIHDAVGRNNHLALGTGEIDLPQRLAVARGRGCRCVLETKTVISLRNSVEWLKHNGMMV